jgi:hypothetical protein
MSLQNMFDDCSVYSFRTISKEHRAKISATTTGRSKTPEHRAKIGAGNKGKTVSEETRANMRAAQAKLLRAVMTPTGPYPSKRHAAEAMGVHADTIQRRISSGSQGYFYLN